MWIKPSSLTGFTNNRAILLSQRTGSTNISYELGVSTNGAIDLTQFSGVGGWTVRSTAASAVTVGSWAHIVATRSTSTVTIYINGVSALSAGGISDGQSVNNGLNIGGLTTQYSAFPGAMDDIRLYDRTLNSAEATALYKQYSSDLSAADGLSSLVGHWKMDGNAKDSSPYGANGTLSAAPTLTTDRTGASNKAYSFDGSNTNNNQSILVTLGGSNTQLNLMGDMSVSAWIKPLSTYFDTAEIVIRVGQGADLVYSMGYDPVNKRPYMQWYDGAFKSANGTSNSALLDQWSHVTIVRSGTNLSFYVNGQFTNTATVTAPTVAASQLSIGRTNNAGVPQDFTGSIDDLRVYKRALTASEITNLYGSYDENISLSSLQKGLVGDWSLNGNAKDATPYSNNGTVNSATLTTDRKGRTNSAYAFTAASSHSVSLGTGVPSLTGGDFTVSLWAKASSGNGTPSVFSQGIPGSWPTNLFIIYYGDTANSNGIRIWHGTSIITNTVSVLDGNWRHVVLTRSGSNFTLYKNAVQAATGTSASNFTSTSSTIGANNNNGTLGQFYNGSLDDIRIWKRALTTAEISTLYNSYR